VFSANIDTQLRLLIEDIIKGNFIPSSASYVYKPKKSNTLRPFAFLAMRDRLVYQAIGNILIENSFEDLAKFSDVQVFSPVIGDPHSDFPLQSGRDRNDKPGQYNKFLKALESRQRDFENGGYYLVNRHLPATGMKVG